MERLNLQTAILYGLTGYSTIEVPKNASRDESQW